MLLVAVALAKSVLADDEVPSRGNHIECTLEMEHVSHVFEFSAVPIAGEMRKKKLCPLNLPVPL